uniref:ubiquitinyl hydrolase 1 n=1 Tax=Aegilops tauschii subsp. strangulata TaxID=200361 RepID=A0A453BZC8_AEGTS
MNFPIAMYHIRALWQTLPCSTPKYTSKGKLSLDFENFHCLPLSPVADINGDIINGCSLVDCLKHFTVLEHLDNYRCDHCWHNAASKYFSLQSEVDEEKVNKLRTCVDYDSCNCKHLFGPEKTTWSVSSKATKQLAITRCPKILCIHLLRASISFDGELVKRQVSTKKDT